MPVETTIEKAKMAMAAGDVHRAKKILQSSFGNYGFSPPLFRAYADVLLLLNEPAQAGRYLFFSLAELEDKKYEEAISAFLATNSGAGYKSIVRAMPGVRLSRLSELPALSRQKLKELGAPEDLTQLYSEDQDWWSMVGCLAAAVAVGSLLCIGLWTVFKWITE